jgi:hypothetical protein
MVIFYMFRNYLESGTLPKALTNPNYKWYYFHTEFVKMMYALAND